MLNLEPQRRDTAPREEHHISGARWKGERRRPSAKNPLHDLLLVLQNRRQGNRPDWPCVGIDPIPVSHAIIGRLAYTGMFRPEGSYSSVLEPPDKAHGAIARNIEQIARRPANAIGKLAPLGEEPACIFDRLIVPPRRPGIAAETSPRRRRSARARPKLCPCALRARRDRVLAQVQVGRLFSWFGRLLS
jgi:hypothetical protein